MTRSFSLAHPLGTGQSNFTIQVHGENPPAPPVARKGKGGRLLRRPQQGHTAATVADFRNGAVAVKHSAITWLWRDTARPFAKRRCWRCGDITDRSGASAGPTSRFQMITAELRLGLRG